MSKEISRPPNPAVQARGDAVHWDHTEEALRELSNGLSVLYGLADSATDGGGINSHQMGQALYFVARNMNRELRKANEALGLSAARAKDKVEPQADGGADV